VLTLPWALTTSFGRGSEEKRSQTRVLDGEEFTGPFVRGSATQASKVFHYLESKACSCTLMAVLPSIVAISPPNLLSTLYPIQS